MLFQYERPLKESLEKLLDSPDVVIEWNADLYDLDIRAARDYLMKNLKGKTVKNDDTGEGILISKRGINEVSHHGSKDGPHIKSLGSIDLFLKNATFIAEANPTKGSRFISFKYYLTGVELEGEHYVSKIVVGDAGNTTYYDHRLSKISTRESD